MQKHFEVSHLQLAPFTYCTSIHLNTCNRLKFYLLQPEFVVHFTYNIHFSLSSKITSRHIYIRFSLQTVHSLYNADPTQIYTHLVQSFKDTQNIFLDNYPRRWAATKKHWVINDGVFQHFLQDIFCSMNMRTKIILTVSNKDFQTTENFKDSKKTHRICRLFLYFIFEKEIGKVLNSTVFFFLPFMMLQKW